MITLPAIRVRASLHKFGQERQTRFAREQLNTTIFFVVLTARCFLLLLILSIGLVDLSRFCSTGTRKAWLPPRWRR